jgi:hypothetical protein
MPTPLDNEREALDAVIARAETDTEFRAQLLSEPRVAIHAAFGVRIPDDFRIRFIERDSNIDALIVLPDLRMSHPAAAAEELSEQDLEQVTGGAHAHNAHLAWKGAVAPKPAPSHIDPHHI